MSGFALPLGRMACSEGMAGFGLVIFPSLLGAMTPKRKRREASLICIK
jgi:hypothetical protein